MLHIVTQSPWQGSALQQCSALLTRDDVLLLTQDGVYAAIADQALHLDLLDLCHHCYAREADVLARGLRDKIAPQIAVIDDEQWVQLTEIHTPVITW
ncbi:Protein TusB [Vibrio stylophorae]|uniref:Protein TusB n=1 Tax=Vibrio stylophorae TaxID=659351 RepID=A0ABN8E0G8_9VIBR|nr:sulfurtransferase complex subunit TusB [Vibrio stylophorae]CAH0534539.1 Protein TusB [Vibrio stylophorae]